MVLKNKLGIKEEIELAKVEEKITKEKAIELFDTGKLETFEVGTYKGLSQIHKYLFQDIYDFAEELRTVNISKSNFRFASAMYLKEALKQIDVSKLTPGEIIRLFDTSVKIERLSRGEATFINSNKDDNNDKQNASDILATILEKAWNENVNE